MWGYLSHLCYGRDRHTGRVWATCTSGHYIIGKRIVSLVLVALFGVDMGGDLAPSLGGRKFFSRTKFSNDLF